MAGISRPARVVVGYDGSVGATAALNIGAALLPEAHAWITHLWTPPFASESMRRRLWSGTRHVDDFVAAVESEGDCEAARLAATGVTVARAAGWVAEPVLLRSYGGEGLQFTEIAEKLDADLVLVGSRGLSGAKAMLGSVSDMVVHYTPRPVLVVPHPLLKDEYDALAGGPVLVGWDGSAGAEAAAAAARRLFPARELVLVSVDGAAEQPSGVSDGSGGTATALQISSRHGSAVAVAEALAACARQRNAAAIVVGSRGRSAVREVLLGSVAIATLHHAFRPVMVVPQADQAGR